MISVPRRTVADIASLIATQLDAAVRTAIVQDVDPAVLAAHHEHRLAADRECLIIADLRHLTVVAAVHPDSLEDLGHLAVEDLLICVDQSVHAIRLYQLVDIHR